MKEPPMPEQETRNMEMEPEPETNLVKELRARMTTDQAVLLEKLDRIKKEQMEKMGVPPHLLGRMTGEKVM
jgi:hypothetical protein